MDDFASVRTFKIFNTNNLWIDLEALHRSVKQKTLQMEIIVNPKTLDSGTNILQLEEAAGAAIKSFNGAFGKNEYIYMVIMFLTIDHSENQLLDILHYILRIKTFTVVMFVFGMPSVM